MNKCKFNVSFLLSVLLSCVLMGCNSGSSDTLSSPQNECFREGEFWYTHYMSLAEDPGSFPDGSQLSTHYDYTLLIRTTTGFSFQGGHDANWKVEATCTSADKATVKITLYNGCPGAVHETYASSTLDIREDGSITISPYYINWTCDDDSVAYVAKEWWEMTSY